MEALHLAFERWNVARNLVIQVSRELILDFSNTLVQEELKTALHVEFLRRGDFEKALRAERG